MKNNGSGRMPGKGKVSMKKMLAVILALTLILPMACISSSAEYAGYDRLDGCENIFLSYTFNCNNWSYGRRTVEGYEPLVGYYDTDGDLIDTFFDTFLFLPCVTTTPSGGRTYRDNNHPSNFSDWQAFVDDVFLDGYNIKALNEAVGDMKAQLGEEYDDYKVKVFLTSLYPVRTQTNFGDVDEDGVTENFSLLADRQKAIKWIIDEQLSRYSAGSFENLELIGFYWFEEDFASSDPHENSLFTYFNSYVHSLGYKTIWIPYNGANGYNRWEELGFDVACYQPNYMFVSSATAQRVADTCDTAKQLGMCVEMEISGQALTSAEYYNRYMDYLRICTEKGASSAIKMYYNDGVNGVYYNAFNSSDPLLRKIYDLTYKYSKDILEPEECQKISVQRPEMFYDIISVGCDYTASAPYTNSDAGYANIDGHELTDGVFGSSDFGTEWYPFHISNIEDDGFYYIDLDLGMIYDDIRFFALELKNDPASGISLPDYVEFYFSEDGSQYSSAGRISNLTDFTLSSPSAVLETDEPVSARYVKVKLAPGDLNFLFASELSVGVKPSSIYDAGGYTNVSWKKSYDSTRAYTDTMVEYADVSGYELTDGIYNDGNALSTAWHAFHTSYAENGKYYVTVDLGGEVTGLSRFVMEFAYMPSASIGLPGNVEFFVSDNGTSFTYVGNAVPQATGTGTYAAKLDTEPCTGRYVKAVFDTGNLHFVFADEFYIGSANDPEVFPTPNAQSGYVLVEDLQICKLIDSGTSVAEFTGAFDAGITITDSTGKAKDASDVVCTGDRAVYTAPSGKRLVMALSVTGDTNGNGTVTVTDYLTAKRILLGLGEYAPAAIAAADFNTDERLNAVDCLLIKRTVLGLS